LIDDVDLDAWKNEENKPGSFELPDDTKPTAPPSKKDDFEEPEEGEKADQDDDEFIKPEEAEEFIKPEDLEE